MFPTLKLSKIFTVWQDALLNNQSLEEFCQAKYGKSLQIHLGRDPAVSLGEQDCPYVLIWQGEKIEGADRKQYRYSIKILWSICNATKLQTERSSELLGFSECDELGQMILETIAAASEVHPISNVSYKLQVEESFPQFSGEMEVRVYIDPLLGTNLNY